MTLLNPTIKNAIGELISQRLLNWLDLPTPRLNVSATTRDAAWGNVEWHCTHRDSEKKARRIWINSFAGATFFEVKMELRLPNGAGYTRKFHYLTDWDNERALSDIVNYLRDGKEPDASPAKELYVKYITGNGKAETIKAFVADPSTPDWKKSLVGLVTK